MSNSTLPYDPGKPIQLLQVGTGTVVVAPLPDLVPPGLDYFVEVIVRPAGPGGAGCTGHASCGSMSLL